MTNKTSRTIVADSYTYNANTKIGTFLNSLNKRERTNALKTITNKTIPSLAVAEALRADGCMVADRTVRDFRAALGV